MATNCYKPDIERDGTSRSKRLPAGLKDGFVKIDERDFDQLLAFTKKTADLYVYYDNTNTATGGWKAFFMQKLQENGLTSPHFALFATFLNLFAIVQDDLNELGTKHLEYYYRDILGFAENDAVPDEVFLIAELAKHISSLELPKDTLFKTGKKVGDIEKLYALKSAFSFNKATIDSICSIYVKNGKRVFASPIANSADGLGEAIETDGGGWLPFGDDSRVETSVGLALEASALRMAEGQRIITITCTLTENSGKNETLNLNNFVISVTGEKEWMNPDLTNLAASGAPAIAPSALLNGSTLTFKFGYSVAAKAIVDYNTEIHGTAFDATYPCLKILFATGETNAARDLLLPLNLKISSVTVGVDVKGLRTLVLQNEQSVLDPAKPVQPFGARPVLKSKFFIGSNEVFSKDLQSVTAKFTWRNLPTESFGNHYAKYHSVTTKPTNASFTAVPQLLKGNEWADKTAIRLFASTGGNDSNAPLATGALAVTGITGFGSDPATDAGKRYTTATNRGYLAFELSGSDFLHDEFQKSYGQGIIEGLAVGTATTRLSYVPNAPYTPELEEFTLDYAASETIGVETGYSTRIGRFFHYGPFGTAEQHKYLTPGQAGVVTLLPAFGNEGELYIGLSNSVPPQNINLLVQVSDGSADPDADEAIVVWSYLSNNTWQAFTTTQLLRENTNGLLKTGLVSLSLPSTATDDNTLLPTGMVWLRVSVVQNSTAVCKIITIIAQASQAKFYSYSGLTPTGETLPAGTISKLSVPNSSVKSFSQPYSSFGGAAKEEGGAFYVRVAERLRHKNRAITVWDYERLTLQNFTYVHQVKAINHTSYNGSGTGFFPLKPGYVTVVLVPDTFNQNALDPLQPKVSRNSLDEVKEFLEGCTTPHAKIEVQNPIYEEIEVKLQVRFIYSEDIDVGIATQKLKDKITELLSPWAYSSEAELLFGTKVHKSTLIYHIEKLEYVDFVQCVEMHVHAPAWLNVDSSKDLDTAITTTAASVFTSYATHTVEPLEGEGCMCEKCGQNIVVTSKFNELEECGCN